MKTIEFSKCFAYSLTTGIDGVSGGTNFTGGADNDIFNAVDDVIAATWTALDKIDGGAGNNTFNASHTGEHFHVVAGTTILEIVDDDLKPCPVGVAWRVLVTNLHSHAMPMIRYDIGDAAQWGPECDCGTKLPVISQRTNPLCC